MGRKLMFVAGLGIGYVLGARAGRERYDKIVSAANHLWESPRVAKARRDVEAYARQQAPVIAERAKAAPGVIRDVADKTAATAKDVADRTTIIAKDVAGRTTVIARDAASRITDGPMPDPDSVVGPLES